MNFSAGSFFPGEGSLQLFLSISSRAQPQIINGRPLCNVPYLGQRDITQICEKTTCITDEKHRTGQFVLRVYINL